MKVEKMGKKKLYLDNLHLGDVFKYRFKYRFENDETIYEALVINAREGIADEYKHKNLAFLDFDFNHELILLHCDVFAVIEVLEILGPVILNTKVNY